MVEDHTVSELREQFPEYHLEYLVGEGGQKKVYRGRHDGQDIVFKLLPLESESGSARAQREIKAMQRISSDGLVELIDFFQTNIGGQDVLVIIEELLHGPTLREVIRQDQISSKEGLRYGIDILETLSAFEDNNIIHRDIKPSNIILVDDGAKLLDVGIARFLTESSLTPTFAPMGPGTPNYAAPEQLENEKELQDARTDIFSTGIVVAEAVSGEHLFEVEKSPIPRNILSGNRKEDISTDFEQPIENKLTEILLKMTETEQYLRHRLPSHAKDDLEELEARL